MRNMQNVDCGICFCKDEIYCLVTLFGYNAAYPRTGNTYLQGSWTCRGKKYSCDMCAAIYLWVKVICALLIISYISFLIQAYVVVMVNDKFTIVFKESNIYVIYKFIDIW